jgi:iron-sulfur cluster assembly protein
LRAKFNLLRFETGSEHDGHSPAEYAEKVEPSDEVVKDKGVRVLIDPKAVLFLLGTEMGYKVEKLAAQFCSTTRTSACGCGESVQLTLATETH